jgi:hypothetical protein
MGQCDVVKHFRDNYSSEDTAIKLLFIITAEDDS